MGVTDLLKSLKKARQDHDRPKLRSGGTVIPRPGLKRTETQIEEMAEELIELYVHQFCENDHICLKKLLEKLERKIIVHVLEETHGNQKSAAEKLGVKPTTLHYRIRRMGLSPVRNRLHFDAAPD